MIKFRVFSLIVVTMLSFSISVSCTRTSDSSKKESSADNTILIGEVDSMTGNEATFGVDTFHGITLAIQEANESGGVRGKKLKLIPSDVQGRPDEGARAISKLITQDKVVAVLTGATSSNALAMAPFAQQNRIPLIATAATNPKLTELGDYIFRVCFIDPFQGEVMAKFALNSLKLKRVAILRDVKSDYSIGLADVFTAVFKAGHGEIVIDQSFSSGDIDFKSQLTAIRSKSPDAIFLPGYYTDVSLIARQTRELGMQMPLLGADGWDSPRLKEIGGEALSGSYFSNFYSSDDPSPKVKSFLAKHKEVYGISPDGSVAMGYEAGRLLVDALKRAKTLDPKDIRDALASTQNMETLNGKMSIDSKRNAVKSAVVLKIEKDGNARYWTTVNP